MYRSMSRLDDRAAIVTGAAVGIGKAIALALAREGAQVVFADIDGSEVESAAAEATAAGGVALSQQVDISRKSETEALISFTHNHFGRLDILVNNAGIYRRGDIVATDEETWDRMLSVNLKSVYLCSRAAIPIMREQGGGVIINLSSSAGWIAAAPGQAAYIASKWGVTGLTKAMATDHLKDGIRVNTICPGPSDTPLMQAAFGAEELDRWSERLPVGRLGDPAEIADAVVFLCSDEARFVNGVTFPVDGGYTAHMP